MAPAPRWQALIDALGEPAWLVDAAAFTVCAANAEALALLGLDQGSLLGQPAENLLATPEDLAFWDAARLGQHQALHSNAVLVHASGRLVQVSRRIRHVPADLPELSANTTGPARPDDAPDDAAGGCHRPGHFLVLVQDRSQAQREADEREQLVSELQATLESTADGILVTDLAGHIRAYNRRFAQIWALPDRLLAKGQDEAVFDWMRRSVLAPEAYSRRLKLITEASLMQASERLVLHSGQVIERVTQPQHCAGRPSGRVWSFRDQTELISAGQRIEALSTTDTLTGLINRRQMNETLAEALRQAKRVDGGLALLLLDLDRFKQINDSLGHEVGDRVLLEAAARLKASMRQGDLVARVAGDQFAVLVHEADHRAAEASARRLLEVVSQPMAVGSLPFTLTASIGVALYPGDANDVETLVRRAESAMQRAKGSGRSCVRFHQPRQDADMRQRMRLDHAMRQALASHRFRLHYQPQVNIATGRVIGAEALIRWRDPELGEVSPSQFIPVAEDTGFIVPIGDWVLEQAVKQAAAWRADGMEMPVSINVSALQFSQGDFQERVCQALRDHGLPGELLELELTERLLVNDADDALARLSQLAAVGVRLAIDDFGTGYSSLAYLKRFPIDRLKIDRSFVKGVPDSESDSAIVRAIVQLSQALGMKVVAEGVETEPQRAFLQSLGCDEFQGFLFAPALDPTGFCDRVQRQHLPSRRARLKLVCNAAPV